MCVYISDFTSYTGVLRRTSVYSSTKLYVEKDPLLCLAEPDGTDVNEKDG
jgi:hypothetical protein